MKRNIMKKLLLVLAAVLLIAALAACGPDNDTAPAPDDPDAPPAEQTPEGMVPETGTDLTAEEEELVMAGETIYNNECAACHMEDGSGANEIYPALAQNPFVTADDPEPVIEIVLYGQGAMPSFAERLDDEDIAAVVSYIRNSWGNEASVVTPEEVQQVR
jgi:mono/diheme cytochrome c family protein